MRMPSFMMDSDLQHPAEMIPDLIDLWLRKQVNMVNTLREEDQELSLGLKENQAKVFIKY